MMPDVRPRLAWEFARRHPFSAGLAVLIVATGIATGALWGPPPATLAASPTTLGPERRWWTPVTALLVPDSILELLLALALVLTLLALAERLLGTARCAALFLGTGAVAVAVGVGLQALSASWGQAWARGDAGDLVLDPIIGISGAVMAATALAPVLPRRRIRLIGFCVLAMFTLYAGDADTVYRLVAALLGLAAGALLARGVPRPGWHRSSFGETRTLIAAIVAVTALGPLIILVTGVGDGPLSPVVAGLRGIDVDAVLDRCSTAPTDRCVADLSTTLGGGIGAFAMALMPLLLALVAAWGLRGGRRAAWLLALAVNLAIAALTIVSISVDEWRRPAELARLDQVFPGFAVVATGVPLAVCALLLLARRRFLVRAGRAAAVRALLVSGGALAVVLLVDVVLVLAMTRHGSPWSVAVDSLRHLLPAGIGRVRVPTTLAGLPGAVHQATGAVFWAAVAVAMIGLLRAPATLPDGDPQRFRALLRSGGGGTMGFMGTWAGTRHWFSPDGRTAVAYRVVSGIALTVSDPVGPPELRAAAVRGFLDLCDGRAWTPVFTSVHDELLPILRDLGWHAIPVGEETVVPLAEFELAGSVWAKVRQPYRRGEREGLTAVWTRWHELSPGLAAQLAALSEQWVAEKALPELRFTLGGLEELEDPDVALALAIDPDGRLQGVTSWLPRWEDGEVVGWTLDFMRRSDAAMPGVMEFLIASVALRMRDEGLASMSLSGAPLARAAEAEPDAGAVVRFLAWLARVLEPAYGFASLARFKAKFNPRRRTLWLAYADGAQLPAIGFALGRAYLPDLSTWEYLSLARALGG